MSASNSNASGWRLPPTGAVHRPKPFLVNYNHSLNREGTVDHHEERLAQWDVQILTPWDVRRFNVSLAKMREINPNIVILAFVPLQNPADPEVEAGLPPNGPGDWWVRRDTGAYCTPPWGGRFMNCYVHDFAWPRLLLRTVVEKCLAGGLYDGVMYDCLGALPHPHFDYDADGKAGTDDDRAAWIAAMSFLLEETRRRYPNAIITGNGGPPWPRGWPFYKWANGCLFENALGDEHLHAEGSEKHTADWSVVWEGMMTGEAEVTGRPRHFYVDVDLQMGRTIPEANVVAAPTSDDLRRLRLGLAITLLRDGAYFGFDRGDCLHGQLWWFDEYGADIGLPVAEYQRDLFGPGTLSRAYQNALVVANTGESSAKVTLSFRHRDVSARAAGKSFDIPPRDGRILARD